MRNTLGQKAWRHGQIDEAGPGDLGLVDIGVDLDERHQALGERAGRHAGGLRQHHGGIGGEIAMGGILRRLERDAVDARLRRHDAVMLQLLDGREHAAVESCKDVHA